MCTQQNWNKLKSPLIGEHLWYKVKYYTYCNSFHHFHHHFQSISPSHLHFSGMHLFALVPVHLNWFGEHVRISTKFVTIITMTTIIQYHLQVNRFFVKCRSLSNYTTTSATWPATQQLPYINHLGYSAQHRTQDYFPVLAESTISAILVNAKVNLHFFVI